MASYKQATGKTIQASFEAFHKANPKVYSHLKRLAFQAINKGKEKISFKLLGNVFRWEVFLKTEDPTASKVQVDDKGVVFKLNDAYISRYSRLFASDHPNHEKKIDFRHLRS